MLQPPVHHPVAFGEKAVPTHIDAVAFVVHGGGNAADPGAHFDDNGPNIRSGKQFVGGGQPCRASSDNDGSSGSSDHVTLMATARQLPSAGQGLAAYLVGVVGRCSFAP